MASTTVLIRDPLPLGLLETLTAAHDTSYSQGHVRDGRVLCIGIQRDLIRRPYRGP